jgi:hypothetical protein
MSVSFMLDKRVLRRGMRRTGSSPRPERRAYLGAAAGAGANIL